MRIATFVLLALPAASSAQLRVRPLPLPPASLAPLSAPFLLAPSAPLRPLPSLGSLRSAALPVLRGLGAAPEAPRPLDPRGTSEPMRTLRGLLAAVRRDDAGAFERLLHPKGWAVRSLLRAPDPKDDAAYRARLAALMERLRAERFELGDRVPSEGYGAENRRVYKARSWTRAEDARRRKLRGSGLPYREPPWGTVSFLRADDGAWLVSVLP